MTAQRDGTTQSRDEPYYTIQEMQETANKDLDTEKKTLYFKCIGTLTWFTGDETRPFYYLACPSCKKKVVEEANGFRCENC